MIDKVCSLEQAISTIHDGDVVALQGGPTQCTPMALVRQLIKAGRTDLHVVCMISGLAVDWLAAAGALRKVTFAAISMEHFGLCRQFRRGVESGAIDVEELSENALLARLAAGARGVPFGLTRGLLGTDLVARSPDTLRMVPDPFGGPPALACRALVPDVALFHAHRADRRGNLASHPAAGYPAFTSLARAARRVIATVEEIVGSDELRRAPDRSIIPGFAVDAVVPVQRGAHPTSLFPDYGYDADLFGEWVAASGDDERARAFLARYVHGPGSHKEYLALVNHGQFPALDQWSGA